MGTRDEMARDADQILARTRAARRADPLFLQERGPARPLRDEMTEHAKVIRTYLSVIIVLLLAILVALLLN